jgi:hypothetical protein
MEKSKLIGSIIIKLKTAYPYYFKDLKEEETLGMYAMYEEELSQYNEETLKNAIKEIIRNSKYMPSLNEIIDQCEKSRTYQANKIVELMWNDGYFKKNNVDESQAYKNYNKTLKFIEEGIIPEWLREDMKKYYNSILTNKEIKILREKVGM